MAQQLTERQKGIADFRDMLYKYNAVFVGDKGLRGAYRKFFNTNKVSLLAPTSQQSDYEDQLKNLFAETKKAD